MINVQLESRSKEFFGVVCLHSFYSDKVSRDLEFEPTAETAHMLKGYSLVFKPVDFGFVVLYNPEYSLGRLREMPKGTKFSFTIRNKNSKLMNFTQIPFWPEGETLFFSNYDPPAVDIPFNPPKDVYYFFKNLKVGEVRKKTLHLSQHALVSLRPRKFSVTIGSGDSSGAKYGDIKIFDEGGSETMPNGTPYRKRLRDANKDLFRRHWDHEVRKMKAQGLPPEEQQKRMLEIADEVEQGLMTTSFSNHIIDLRHASYGKYVIEWKKGSQEEVYLMEEPSNKFFGVLDIYFDSREDALLHRDAAEAEDVVRPQMYYMNLESRTTYWRYYFMNYKNSTVSPSSIRDENNDLSFTEPVETILEQLGTPTVICESTHPIPLKEHPEHVLFLERVNGKRSMKEIRLPTPGPDTVKPERGADKGYKIYSDVFVYL